MQSLGFDAFTACSIREPTVGSDQLDPCTDVEGNIPIIRSNCAKKYILYLVFVSCVKYEQFAQLLAILIHLGVFDYVFAGTWLWSADTFECAVDKNFSG